MITKQPHPANNHEDRFRGCASAIGCGGAAGPAAELKGGDATGGVTGLTGGGTGVGGIGAGSRIVGA